MEVSYFSSKTCSTLPCSRFNLGRGHYLSCHHHEFITCFSGCMPGLIPLFTPCTSSKVILLDLDCNLVCISYFPSSFLSPK